MPLTTEEVRWAYRILLDRDPENDAVLAQYRALGDMTQVRRSILSSSEFADRNAGFAPRRTLPSTLTRIEVYATENQERLMLERIAREWRRFGEQDAHWSVLTSEAFRTERLAETIDAFYESGVAAIEQILAPLRRLGISQQSIQTVLDFGCGVGRLSLALAARFPNVHGVDISPAHIRHAEARKAAVGKNNVLFSSIDALADLDRYRNFDLVVSVIVLQHNPPPIIARILKELLLSLAMNGTAIVQIPTYLPGYSFSIDRYLSNAQPAMEMNALPQADIFQIVADCRCAVIEVQEDDWMGASAGVSQTFVIRRFAF